MQRARVRSSLVFQLFIQIFFFLHIIANSHIPTLLINKNTLLSKHVCLKLEESDHALLVIFRWNLFLNMVFNWF